MRQFSFLGRTELSALVQKENLSGSTLCLLYTHEVSSLRKWCLSGNLNKIRKQKSGKRNFQAEECANVKALRKKSKRLRLRWRKETVSAVQWARPGMVGIVWEGGKAYTIKGPLGYGMEVGLYFECNGRPQSDFIWFTWFQTVALVASQKTVLRRPSINSEKPVGRLKP